MSVRHNLTLILLTFLNMTTNKETDVGKLIHIDKNISSWDLCEGLEFKSTYFLNLLSYHLFLFLILFLSPYLILKFFLPFPHLSLFCYPLSFDPTLVHKVFVRYIFYKYFSVFFPQIYCSYMLKPLLKQHQSPQDMAMNIN